MAEDAAVIVRQYLDGIWAGDLGVLDRYLSPDFVDHTPGREQGPGREGLKEALRGDLEIGAERRYTLRQLLCDGDRVAVHWTGTFRDTGAEIEGRGPSGRTITFSGIDLYRVETGRIAERWGYDDSLHVLQDEGILPTLREQAGIYDQAAAHVQGAGKRGASGCVLPVAAVLFLGGWRTLLRWTRNA